MRSFKHYLFAVTCILFMVCTQPLHAHVTDADLSHLSGTDIAFLYLKLGFTHILPLGCDHILFVLSIFLLNPGLKSVIIQATVFTIAHSITLALAMFGLISSPAHVIEPIIALSIFFVAVENTVTDKLKPTRILIVFIFGLIHGLGFAGALSELGLPENRFFTSLLTFNIGVELGQITIILLAWILVGKWFGKKVWYKKAIVIPVSVLIAAIALYWTIQRVFYPL